MTNKQLVIKNLKASINNREILKGLNLKINPGEVHAIMGPNGSGKSTLANVLSGKNGYKISGEVKYLGESLNDIPVEERAQKGIFLVRIDANYSQQQILWYPAGGSSWSLRDSATGLPSNFSTSGYDRISLANFYGGSSSHEFSGKIAECAYWKGTYLTDKERDRMTTYLKTKFNF